ncbi:MAG: carboxypeptidase regulatory-like domain-containing protein [Gammaproteobacteria bacterium]|nr:carboxypeptidase regulatory-like domain-containing protein [Gammaproteobacteria bacterium]
MNRSISGLAACMLCAASAVGAADLSGTVQDAGGKPLAGVFVTARSAARGWAVSVVSDAQGHYRLPDLAADSYSLTGARLGHESARVDALKLGASGAQQDLKLGVATDANARMPGYAWLAALPNSEFKARFITGCTICHDAGAERVRLPKDHAGWVAAIEMMRNRKLDVYSVIPDFDNNELADWLVKNHFGEKPAAVALPDPAKDATAHAVIREYDVGDANSWAHDMAVEPATGAVWVGDYPYDKLIRVDPDTAAQKVYMIPVKGGGAHTLHFDREGGLWITLQLADKVVRFDPKTENFKVYAGFQAGSLIHSFAYDGHGLIQTDKQGRLWMSEFGKNAVASLDPASGEVREYALPGAVGHTYGIALDSHGRAWYTKYNENIFGMFDPATGKATEKVLPRPSSAPHRMAIDGHDRLWIPLSGYGVLARYDITADRLEEIPLPEPDTFPYAARYDADSDSVWVMGNGASSLYRYWPAAGHFDSYRLPSPISYGRMIAVDYERGEVWTSLANYPTKHTGRTTATLVRVGGLAPAPGK